MPNLKNDWEDHVGDQYTAAHANAVADAVNTVADAASAAVATSEQTNSSTYADLATTTDTVTVTIGANGLALVCIQSWLQASAPAALAWASFAVSGANTLAASDERAVSYAAASGTRAQSGTTVLLTGLNPGSTTFKMKYKSSTGNATFENRRIGVVPL